MEEIEVNVRVVIWDWHGTAKEKLEELGYARGDVIEMTQEQIFTLAEHFTVMLRKTQAEVTRKGKVITPKPDYDMVVAVTTYRNFNQR